jgi:hypothetical protein
MLNSMRGFCEEESLLRQLGALLDHLLDLLFERSGYRSDNHGDTLFAIWDMPKKPSNYGIRLETYQPLALEIGQ